MVSEKKTFKGFHYKSMRGNDPWGVVTLDTWGLISRIYEGDF